eukprot:CAMPEP_0170549370 /NCGR_PEP_ID=MMETSP0211-20121228/7523_1 /TAXON_ID=311385 /ORGANISM="Pseudokeronopsis sp., Strain OXSARD2" /LENGTH=156 /DNA_ID=CAMNT_0010855331 /DNA_START=280 /DNA_END=750 /DNA_ORIENTATION=-
MELLHFGLPLPILLAHQLHRPVLMFLHRVHRPFDLALQLLDLGLLPSTLPEQLLQLLIHKQLLVLHVPLQTLLVAAHKPRQIRPLHLLFGGGVGGTALWGGIEHEDLGAEVHIDQTLPLDGVRYDLLQVQSLLHLGTFVVGERRVHAVDGVDVMVG